MPTSVLDGVPVSSPVAELKLLQWGWFEIPNRNTVPPEFLATGRNQYGWFATTCLFGAPVSESDCVVAEPPVFVAPVLEEPFVTPGIPLGMPLSPSLQALSMRVRRIVTVPNTFFEFDPFMRCSQGVPRSSAARALRTVQDNGSSVTVGAIARRLRPAVPLS
jgi:hypothetical protein